MTAFGMFVALCVSQTGSLFSADAWHNVTFVAGEVRNPKRNLPLALGIGTSLVVVLYLLCNFAYLAALPMAGIQNAPSDRVATQAVNAVLPGIGALAMGLLIMVSTFGTVNAMTMAGARACYAMAQDGLFFRRAGVLNKRQVPGWGLLLQCCWSMLLVLPRTYDASTGKYGNLYSNLLDYVISAELLFYILTVSGLFRLRATRPHAVRPYRCWGYPWLPAFYVLGADGGAGRAVLLPAGDDVAGAADCGGGSAGVLAVAAAERGDDPVALWRERTTAATVSVAMDGGASEAIAGWAAVAMVAWMAGRTAGRDERGWARSGLPASGSAGSGGSVPVLAVACAAVRGAFRRGMTCRRWRWRRRERGARGGRGRGSTVSSSTGDSAAGAGVA